MKKLLLSLYLSLSLSLSNAAEVTTQNLVDQNFDNGGWSGTADGRHGSNIIAAEHNTYIESNSVAVNDHLTKDQINNGFSVNASERIWHWNDYDSTVQRTIRATIPNSTEVITQTRSINSIGCGYVNCGNYISYNDTMVIGSNTVDNYNINLRYDFTDTSQNNNAHWSVDLKEPTLTITYEENPIRLETTTVNTINETFEDIKENLKFENEIKFEDTIELKEEPKLLESFVELPKEEFKESPLEVAQEEKPIETKEEPQELESNDEPKEEVKESSSETATTESDVRAESNTEQKVVQQKEEKAEANVEANVGSVESATIRLEQSLKAENLIKLNLMVDNTMLQQYNNTIFYKEKKLYENQIDIRDNRILYDNVTLVSYSKSDPIFSKQKELFEIQLQKQKLKSQIRRLKNG